MWKQAERASVVILSLFLSTHSALAIDFLFNPIMIEGEVAPGTTETAEFELWSKNANTFVILVDQAWPPVPEKSDKNPYPVSEWLHISQTTISVEAGTTTKIPFMVSARPDAKGEVAAYLTVKAVPVSTEERSPMTMAPALGPTIYVSFPGTEEPRGELKDFGWTYDAKEQTIQFQWKIRSSGNVHLRTREEISICSRDNKQVFNKISVPLRAPAFPGQTISLSENFKPSDLLDLEQEYRVEIKAYYGEGYDKPDLVFTAARTGRLNRDVH